jgi:hypothetical protein
MDGLTDHEQTSAAAAHPYSSAQAVQQVSASPDSQSIDTPATISASPEGREEKALPNEPAVYAAIRMMGTNHLQMTKDEIFGRLREAYKKHPHIGDNALGET